MGRFEMGEKSLVVKWICEAIGMQMVFKSHDLRDHLERESAEERQEFGVPWEHTHIRQSCVGSKGLGRAGHSGVQSRGPAGQIEMASDNHNKQVQHVRILRDPWERKPGKRIS